KKRQSAPLTRRAWKKIPKERSGGGDYFAGAGASSVGGSKLRARRNSGNQRAQSKVTRIAPAPPPTTAAMGPINEARKPDSASPSSFDAEMKSEDTAPTRP